MFLEQRTCGIGLTDWMIGTKKEAFVSLVMTCIEIFQVKTTNVTKER